MKQTPEKQDEAPPRAEFALGIVTRMGRNPQGFGAAGIEPGPAGKRPGVESLSHDEIDGYRKAAQILRALSQIPAFKGGWFALRVSASRLERLASEAAAAAGEGGARAEEGGRAACPPLVKRGEQR